MSISSTVRDILKQKGTASVWGVAPDETVYEAIKKMAIHNVGALIVFELGKIVGIISERDYARKVVINGRSSDTTLVKEIMDTMVPYALLEDTAEESLALMTAERIRHLPVFDGDSLCGLVSMGDVVNALISDREFIIDQLTRYITDSYTSRYTGTDQLRNQ